MARYDAPKSAWGIYMSDFLHKVATYILCKHLSPIRQVNKKRYVPHKARLYFEISLFRKKDIKDIYNEECSN